MGQYLVIATKALALCAGAFLYGGAAWAKDEPIFLAQSDKWIANFDTESCQLLTSFGDGDGKVLFRLSRYSPGDSFVLDLFGRAFRSDESHSKVKFQFGPNGTVVEKSSDNGKAGTLPLLMLGSTNFLGRAEKDDENLTLITPEHESAVRWLDVKVAGRTSIRLQTGSMNKAMQVMRTCIGGLFKSWGYDLDVMKTYLRQATPLESPGNWLRSNDYPMDMLRQGGQGIVHFRVDVDEMGNVSGCHIQQRTKPDGFADLTCKLITKRAKFSPALDAQGKPIRSIYVNTVRWIIT